jgi:hypothetical protein
MKARTIPVATGDVFCRYAGDLVVIGHELNHAVCRPCNGGRTTRIKKRRLQEEYDRAGGKRAAKAHRELARRTEGR